MCAERRANHRLVNTQTDWNDETNDFRVASVENYYCVLLQAFGISPWNWMWCWTQIDDNDDEMTLTKATEAAAAAESWMTSQASHFGYKIAHIKCVCCILSHAQHTTLVVYNSILIIIVMITLCRLLACVSVLRSVISIFCCILGIPFEWFANDPSASKVKKKIFKPKE